MALGLALAAGPAWGHPRVMVWPGAPVVPVAEAEQVLRDRGVEVVPWSMAREALAVERRASGERRDQRHQALEAALAEAQQRFLELELDAMLAGLEAAEPEALALARPSRCDGLWALEFRRGLGLAIRGAEGDAEASRQRYALALALDPQRRPPAELYGPDVTAGFLKVVEEQGVRVSAPVPLRVQPADAAVEIDCREVDDDAPALRAGLHAVRVSAPGYEPWSGVVEVGRGEPIEIALLALPDDLPPARRLGQSTDADLVDDGSSSAHAAVLPVSRAQGAEAILVVRATAEGWRVRAWGQDGIGAAVERADLPTALDVALRLLDDDGRLRTPEPVARGSVDPRPPPPSRKPVLRTWWFWTIVGTVAVTAVGVGLGVGLRPDPQPGKLVIVAR